MMKKKYILLLLILCMGMISCNRDLEIEEMTPEEMFAGAMFGALPGTYNYNIKVSVSDTYGNDLVSPLSDEQWIKPAPDDDVYDYPWAGGINPAKYALDLKLSHSDVLPRDIPGIVYYDKRYPLYEMTMEKYDPECKRTDYTADDGKYYLSNSFGYSQVSGWDIALACGISDYMKENPPQEYIIYQLQCPTVFGDNLTHELVTYWGDDLCFPSDDPESSKKSVYPNCYKALFDGKEIPVKTVVTKSYEWRYFYDHFIDIVLDK